ncbi:MAG: hypothetical protein IJJ31_02795 [Mogibacterium sp.]|nr:hypothetical protein [Mogibacterium sp.]
MADRSKNSRYEQLYTQLLERGEMLHENNKKRIRHGLILLAILPLILGFIIWITGSSKIVFLIFWIICMFIISAYLISVEYLDDSVQKTLEEVTDRESDFDESIPRGPEMDLQKRIEARLAERHAAQVPADSETAEADSVMQSEAEKEDEQ